MILKCTCSPAWPQLPITSTVLNNCFGVFRKLETEPELFKTLNRVYVFSSQCCPLLSLVTFWKVSLLTSRGQTVVNSHYKTQYIVLNTYNVKAFTSSNNIQVTALSCFAWMGHTFTDSSVLFNATSQNKELNIEISCFMWYLNRISQ